MTYVQKKMFEQKRFAGRHLLTFESQKLINVFPRIVFVRTFFLHISRESNNIYCFCLIIFVLIY